MTVPSDPSRLVTATCTTADCPNNGIPITLEVPDVPDPHVVCGVCRQQIHETASTDEDTQR